MEEASIVLCKEEKASERGGFGREVTVVYLCLVCHTPAVAETAVP